MKTARKRNRKAAAWISIMALLVILACKFPLLFFPSSQDSDMQPTQSFSSTNNNQTACLTGIVPGQTNRAEVIAILGEPLGSQQDGAYETLRYASPLRGQYNTVYLGNRVVNSISVVLAGDTSMSWSEVTAKYGEPGHTSYSTYLQGSFNLVFPEQGLNFIADPDLDIVFIQECFVPVSLEDYLRVYGDLLLQENPFTK